MWMEEQVEACCLPGLGVCTDPGARGGQWKEEEGHSQNGDLGRLIWLFWA
jgi:hypothetical protein